jgi:large subunit ribosomal protein L25
MYIGEGKGEPLPVSFNEKELMTSLDKERRRNTVLTLNVSQPGTSGQGEQVTAMVRDAQINPLSRRLVHVDFLRVDLNEEVEVTVPLVLTGKAVGTTNGGNLHQSMYRVPIAAKPAAIPTKLEVDVTPLDIGDALHVSDLKLGAGVRALLDPRESIASVVAPKAEKVEEAAAPAEEAADSAESEEAVEPEASFAPTATKGQAPAGTREVTSEQLIELMQTDPAKADKLLREGRVVRNTFNPGGPAF